MTSSNVAAALRELECADLVRRVRDPEDGRRVRLSMTDAGADAVSCLHAERDTWLGRAVEALLSDDDQITLLRAGELMQRLAEYDDTPPPIRPTPRTAVDPSGAATSSRPRSLAAARPRPRRRGAAMSSGGRGFAASNGASAPGGMRSLRGSAKKPPPLMDPTRKRDGKRIRALFKPYRVRLTVVL